MALQRKPVKTERPPDYPVAQEYAKERRHFLVKLGITAAGLLGLAGCGEATQSQSSVTTPAPANTAPAKWPVFNTPATPQTAMPGNMPPPNLMPTPAPPPNSAKNPATPQPAVPQAPVKGGECAPARPAAVTGGEPVAPEMIQTPAKKEEK